MATETDVMSHIPEQMRGAGNLMAQVVAAIARDLPEPKAKAPKRPHRS